MVEILCGHDIEPLIGSPGFIPGISLLCILAGILPVAVGCLISLQPVKCCQKQGAGQSGTDGRFRQGNIDCL
jgi:hypothetical protein